MLSDAAFNDDILTNLALSSISTQKKAGDRFIYKSSKVQKWQMFSESDRRGIVWGLTTNGMQYQFVLIRQGNPLTYQQMPLLNLMDSESAIKLLQVLKAICKLQNSSQT